jgi:lipopolysaccharide export LptBFGC system permease protein LptF
MFLSMKKILVITILLFFCCKVLFAASITEELTQLNNLYKEGAITEEEFSKAKSILLKTNSSNEQSKTKKVKKKKIKKIRSKNKTKEEKIIAKKIETNEDLTKTYMHIDELQELGNFVAITEAPEGMFETKSEHFSPKVKEAQQKMYLTFVQKKGLMEKYPENLFKAMGYFEFFYMEQLKKETKKYSKI